MKSDFYCWSSLCILLFYYVLVCLLRGNYEDPIDITQMTIESVELFYLTILMNEFTFATYMTYLTIIEIFLNLLNCSNIDIMRLKIIIECSILST